MEPQSVRAISVLLSCTSPQRDVLPEVPDLIEINYQNELLDSQRRFTWHNCVRCKTAFVIASDSEINRQKIEILSGITRLRQICDTPKLL